MWVTELPVRTVYHWTDGHTTEACNTGTHARGDKRVASEGVKKRKVQSRVNLRPPVPRAARLDDTALRCMVCRAAIKEGEVIITGRLRSGAIAAHKAGADLEQMRPRGGVM